MLYFIRVRRLAFIIVGFSALVFVSACTSEHDANQKTQLRVSALPDQSSERVEARYLPLLSYLEAETKVKYSFQPVDTYATLVERFAAGEIDMALFGGFTFVQARALRGAVPIVMRDVDARFVSVFIVPTDSPAKVIEDLEGKRLAFGSELSTSGHLMPRYFLLQKGINPETFFSSVAYTGTHDRTVEWVRAGKADVGAANAVVVSELLESKAVSDREIRVLWTTPPYADYVWAVQPTLDPTLRDQLIEAFLKLSADQPAHRKILEGMRARMFLPASVNDFSALEGIGRNVGLIKDH